MSARRRLSPDQRRSELLDEAQRLVNAEGLSALSLEAVAEGAGCSRNLAYTYFPNRDALVEALSERFRAHLGQRVIEGIPRPADFDTWLRAWTKLVFDEAESAGPMLLLLFEGERAIDPGQRFQRNQVTIDMVEIRVREVMRTSPTRTRAVASLLIGALIGGLAAVARDGVPRRAVEHEFLALVDKLVHADPS